MRGDWEPLLEQLVRERYTRLLARAMLLVGARGDADDLVQEALLSTFSGRARLTSVEAAEQYVRRAIVSRFIDRLRRDGREAIAHDEASRLDAPPAQQDVSTELEAALALLAPRERACVVLRHLEQMSVAETAEHLHLSDGAVKRYTFDGLRTLSSALGTRPPSDDVPVRLVPHQSAARPTDGSTHQEASHGA
ncbi:sigma-70 family RNA polymerase sigma factor [Cellulomonas edaphi]|uniref:Sigma-70 family RNA polymerase sigma factor n=1 Tax=Cellulomonas edaphi TaxID=3053468 RepID=A0ABT7S762_9CELL|nr:sigma-70 family RNA polymerase sigma factor [Cellulomons edaphi]MDM7831458.1 sigma-70 family RNA polymerase sigma factor [Cellulomons edaphi]